MCMMEFKNFKTILLIKIYNILFFLVFSVLYHEISSIKAMANSISMNRITTEYRKLQKYSDEYFVTCPLEDNLFEWDFIFRGKFYHFYD